MVSRSLLVTFELTHQSLAYLQQESTPRKPCHCVKAYIVVHPDSIWSLAWTPQNQVISACADGRLRVYDSTQLSAPLHDIGAHPLAVSSLSTNSTGSRALSISLDGTAVLLDPIEGSVLGRVETGREKAAAGEGGGLIS